MSVISGTLGAILGSSATKEAANTQAQAAMQAAQMQLQAAQEGMALQREQYQQSRADLTPWRKTGQAALTELNRLTYGGQGVQGGAAAGGTAHMTPAMTQTADGRLIPATMAQFTFAPGQKEATGQVQHVLIGGNLAGQLPYDPNVDPNLDPGLSGRAPAGQGTGQPYFHDFGMADFEHDPGYQFRLSEGMKAIQASAASRGGLLSGRALKDIGRFSQNTASDEFLQAYNRFTLNRSNRFNRLASLAGIGQQATSTTAQLGQGSAMAQQQALLAGANAGAEGVTGAANARASGYIGQANAYSSALQQTGNFGQALGYRALNQWMNQPAAAATIPASTPYASLGSSLAATGAAPEEF